MKHLLLFSLAAFILSCQAPSPKSNQFDKFNENAASADSTFNLLDILKMLRPECPELDKLNWAQFIMCVEIGEPKNQ